ncbi:MAG: hypothetical protein N4A62_05135 [Marinisporobacter sp.]|jgi:hypothetical protein|nr:hypothetical protein [Marinisporobacter sp.]
MYDKLLKLFHKNNIKFEEYNHESILDYEKAKAIRNRLGLKVSKIRVCL